MPRILVIEDELPMRVALTDLLLAQSYQVITASDGVGGLDRALNEKPDLVLLDVMMPKLDGFSVCREIRHFSPNLPVLILTAKGLVDDRVTGLDAGADDYLVKPFSSRELLARVRALLRRQERSRAPVDELTLGAVLVDFTKQLCSRDGQRIALSAKEFAILKVLAEHRGEPVSREHFLETVWGYNAYPTTRTVDNQIVSLRAKIEDDPAAPRFITTVHGVGYRLESQPPIPCNL